MNNKNVKTLMDFMAGAQTILALYGSPKGPTDPLQCYKLLVELLEDPDLLAAQMDLNPNHKVVMLLGEPYNQSPVL